MLRNSRITKALLVRLAKPRTRARGSDCRLAARPRTRLLPSRDPARPTGLERHNLPRFSFEVFSELFRGWRRAMPAASVAGRQLQRDEVGVALAVLRRDTS